MFACRRASCLLIFGCDVLNQAPLAQVVLGPSAGVEVVDDQLVQHHAGVATGAGAREFAERRLPEAELAQLLPHRSCDLQLFPVPEVLVIAEHTRQREQETLLEHDGGLLELDVAEAEALVEQVEEGLQVGDESLATDVAHDLLQSLRQVQHVAASARADVRVQASGDLDVDGRGEQLVLLGLLLPGDPLAEHKRIAVREAVHGSDRCVLSPLVAEKDVRADGRPVVCLLEQLALDVAGGVESDLTADERRDRIVLVVTLHRDLRVADALLSVDDVDGVEQEDVLSVVLGAFSTHAEFDVGDTLALAECLLELFCLLSGQVGALVVVSLQKDQRSGVDDATNDDLTVALCQRVVRDPDLGVGHDGTVSLFLGSHTLRVRSFPMDVNVRVFIRLGSLILLWSQPKQPLISR